MKPHFYITIIVNILFASTSFGVIALDEQFTAESSNIVEHFNWSDVLATQELEAAIGVADAQSQVLLEPIYIGGARYQLNGSDFKYTIVATTPPAPPHLHLIHYRASIPVYGDFGQDLFFDVFGDSGAHILNIKTSCGTYNDNDSGPKYVMSKIMRTAGSCQILNVEFYRSIGVGANPNVALKLTVLIYEQL